jgi:hypothetical protein
MSHVLNFTDFLLEADLSEPIKQPLTLNYSDETLEGLRRHFLDKYLGDLDKEKQETVNKCISTYVYALDKKLKIDGDIVDLLADALGKDSEAMAKELADDTREFYDKKPNIIG